MAIRVLLVDDHAIVREGYRRLIEKHRGIEVIAEAGDAPSGYEAFKKLKPDVVVIDISMPGRGGIDLVRQIRQREPGARILVFSMHASPTYAQQAFRAGARGYVTKSSSPDLLISAIRDVFQGRPALCPEINQAIATNTLSEDVSSLDTLSPREFEILRMILNAKSTDEIAAALNLSPKTVANYHCEIRSKLGVRSDIELVYFCIKKGLVAPLTAPGSA